MELLLPFAVLDKVSWEGPLNESTQDLSMILGLRDE